MEAVMYNGSHPDQAISPHKSHITCSRRFSNPFTSDQNVQLQKMGILQPPSSFISHSYPPFFSQQSPLPPLLPLPAATHRHGTIARGQSCPPLNKRTNHNNKKINHSLTPKKSPSPNKNSIKPPSGLGNMHQAPSYSQNSTKPPVFSKNSAQILPFTRTLGPNPKKQQMDVKKSSPTLKLEEEDLVHMFSGTHMFTISPPPSSLPLPTFTLRPKLSCNTAIDSRATDSLIRLLQLR